MSIIFNHTAFAETLKAKRDSMELGVREAAEQIGNLSASTLSRIENGKIPDLPDFLAICAWMNRDPSEFWKRDSAESSTREQVRSILAQDGRIGHEIIMAIDAIIKLATEGNHG
jgi:transcriptional regulator with XRE-family HTH domain